MPEAAHVEAVESDLLVRMQCLKEIRVRVLVIRNRYTNCSAVRRDWLPELVSLRCY